MDKFQILTELSEHPEKYSDQEIEEILHDPETRDLYNTLCDSDSALRPETSLSRDDVDREWERFRRKNLPDWKRRSPFAGLLRRKTAVITAITISSAAALAIGINLMQTKPTRSHTPLSEEEMDRALPASTYIVENVIGEDTVSGKLNTVVFENRPLDTILSVISRHYGLELDIRRKETGKLRLFYKWEPGKKPEEVVSQLNNFEKINASLSEGKIVVE